MRNEDRTRSTAVRQRQVVLRAATTAFARNGYVGTPVSEVAGEAGLSQGYVLRLFGTKLSLFVAVIDQCFDQVVAMFDDGLDRLGPQADAEVVLDALGDRYAGLIAESDVLMIQVHAQSAAAVPEVRAALRRGLERVVTFLRERTAADEAAVQRFIAYGLLCHLIVTAQRRDDPPALTTCPSRPPRRPLCSTRPSRTRVCLATQSPPPGPC